MTITDCPSRWIGRDIIETIELIHHAENHDWPVAGGMLDQADNFRQALRAWKESVAEIKKQQQTQ